MQWVYQKASYKTNSVMVSAISQIAMACYKIIVTNWLYDDKSAECDLMSEGKPPKKMECSSRVGNLLQNNGRNDPPRHPLSWCLALI